MLRVLEAQYGDIEAYLIGLEINSFPIDSVAELRDNAYY